MILLDSDEKQTRILVLFRDLERGRRISVAVNEDLASTWAIYDITPKSVGQSDPLCDLQVWQAKREIHLFTQFVGQGDSETQEDVPPQTVSVIEWHPPTVQ